jgi:hypothetical protein
MPKRQVTQPQVVPTNADDDNRQGLASRSSSQTLNGELAGGRFEEVLPPSKPVRQVSIDSFPAPAVVDALPPLPIITARSDARRSRRRSSKDHYPRFSDDEPTQGRSFGARAVSAPLTPLPSTKAPVMFATRMMSPSSSSNASSSSSSRSSVMKRRVDSNRFRQ